MAKSKYSVKRYWEVCDEIEIVAESPEQASALAYVQPLTAGEYVPDSMNVDEEDIQKITAD